MKPVKLIVLIATLVVVSWTAYYFAFIHNANSTDCSKVTKATIPSDVVGQPNDIFTGAAAQDLCRQLHKNLQTEGGRVQFEFR